MNRHDKNLFFFSPRAKPKSPLLRIKSHIARYKKELNNSSFLRLQLRDILAPRLTPEIFLKKSPKLLHANKTPSKLIIHQQKPKPLRIPVKSEPKKFYLPSLYTENSLTSSNSSLPLCGYYLNPN